jgi:phosphoribosylglycinamide formyltransferase-1
MKVVVLASGNGSTFQALLDNCEHANIAALVTNNPNSYALVRAKKARIPYAVCKHNQIRWNTWYHQPDLVVLAGYMRIIPKTFLDRFPNTVNIHPSLLPKYKGLGTYDRVIAAGDSVHGTTVHWVTDELDAGPIIAQESFPVWQMDTAEILMDKTKELERELYPKVLDEIATGVIPLVAS